MDLSNFKIMPGRGVKRKPVGEIFGEELAFTE